MNQRMTEIHLYLDMESVDSDFENGIIESGPAELLIYTLQSLENKAINAKSGNFIVRSTIPDVLLARADFKYIHFESKTHRIKLEAVADILFEIKMSIGIKIFEWKDEWDFKGGD